VAKVRCQIAVSLDGYVAGPNQSEEHPLGEGGEDLHEWIFTLPAWQEAHGREADGGEDNPSNTVIREAQENVGAVLMGRNMFGPVRGEWGDSEWKGWWGEEPPFHVPTFVLTHHERAPIEMAGGTSFQFVTEGIERAVALAKEAAGERDVSVGGGGATIQQCIRAGLLDELTVNLVPILLGGGTRLFDDLGPADPSFEPAGLIEAPGVTHLKYRLVS
jgi:dihydrofolate reductase